LAVSLVLIKATNWLQRVTKWHVPTQKAGHLLRGPCSHHIY
jgi:hypothetical protein